MIRNYNLLSGSRDTRLKKYVKDDSAEMQAPSQLQTRWLACVMLFLSVFFGQNAFSQVAYNEAFTTNIGGWATTAFPQGTHSQYTGTTACGGSGGSVRANLYASVTSGIFTSPLLGTANGLAHTMSFDFKVADWSANTSGTTGNWGSVLVQWGTTASGPWTTIGTIDSSNHTASGSCSSKLYNFTPANGDQVYVRFSSTWLAGDYYINFDNVAVTGAAVVVPPCTSGLVPANAAIGVSRNPTLSWAAATGGTTSYDVYLGTTPNPPFVANVTGLTYAPALLPANTLHYWKIVPKNNVGDAVGCVEQSFTTGTGFTYCVPTYGSGCSGDNIASVAINGLSDTGLTCTPTYEDRSGVQNIIPVLSQNTTETLTLTLGTDSNQYNAVWIDFNQNGTYETSEYFSTLANAGASGTQNIPMLIPSGALSGITKMRVRGGGDSQTTSGQACGAASSGFGSARDYTVNIGPPPACPAASGLSATGLSTTGATLNWNCTGCTGTFTVEYNTAPATFGGVGNVVINNATTGTVIGGLSQNTNYTFFVRQDCGVDGFSTVNSLNFTTPSGGESCVDGQVLTVYPDLASAVTTTLLTGVTADGPPGTCSNATGNPNKKDRWVSFVAPSNGNKIRIVTSAGTGVSDMVMQVWDACPAVGTAIGCNDDSVGLMPALEFCQNQYIGGQTYYVQVWPYSDFTTGNFGISIYEEAACPLPPANDECAGVETISVGFAGSCPDNATFGTTVNATSSPGIVKAGCDPFGTYLDVFYTFNSGSNTDISFTFDNITGTNEFGIYDGCGTTYLGICSSGDYQTIITGLTPNTDYHIVVWSNTIAAAGTFSICISALPAPECVAAPIAPTNGATGITTCAATTLSWNAVPNAVAYDVYFNAGTSATVLVSDNQPGFTGTNTYNAGILAGATTYAWRIVPINSVGSPEGCIDFTFTTGAATATPGDTFAGAIDLGLVTTSVTASGDTTCYANDFTTTSTPGSVNAAGSKDIFYKFEIGCDSPVTAGICVTNFDTYLHILDSTGAPVLNGFDDDDCPTNAGSLIENLALTAGVYYAVVEGFSTNQGTFTLDIARGGASCSSTVNLKMFIEGYYLPGGSMTTVADNQAGIPPTTTDVEMITVELRDAVAPYALVDTTTAMLQTDGTVVCEFSTSPVGSYYIVVKTRNTVETWSATPQPVGTTPLIYNFTNAASKAFGDNMIELEAGVFALFSGDIMNAGFQDGFVDLTDFSTWEFDNNEFAFGSFATDLNGDGFVDLTDFSIWEANNNNFVGAVIPF